MSKLRAVSYKQLVKVFEAEGFVCVRTEGDHMVFTIDRADRCLAGRIDRGGNAETILHEVGLDHKTLTYYFNGRNVVDGRAWELIPQLVT